MQRADAGTVSQISCLSFMMSDTVSSCSCILIALNRYANEMNMTKKVAYAFMNSMSVCSATCSWVRSWMERIGAGGLGKRWSLSMTSLFGTRMKSYVLVSYTRQETRDRLKSELLKLPCLFPHGEELKVITDWSREMFGNICMWSTHMYMWVRKYTRWGVGGFQVETPWNSTDISTVLAVTTFIYVRTLWYFVLRAEFQSDQQEDTSLTQCLQGFQMIP